MTRTINFMEKFKFMTVETKKLSYEHFSKFFFHMIHYFYLGLSQVEGSCFNYTVIMTAFNICIFKSSL
jgi:hypothetical protein